MFQANTELAHLHRPCSAENGEKEKAVPEVEVKAEEPEPEPEEEVVKTKPKKEKKSAGEGFELWNELDVQRNKFMVRSVEHCQRRSVLNIFNV